MCGILCVYGPDAENAATKPQVRANLIKRSKRLRHRGPDGTGVMICSSGIVEEELKTCENGNGHCHVNGTNGSKVSSPSYCFMAHERLNIVDASELGAQPQSIELEDGGTIMWMCNGEIYNHSLLRSHELKDCNIVGHSDCAVIGHLYLKFGASFVGMLDGVFAVVLFDSRNGSLIVARGK